RLADAIAQMEAARRIVSADPPPHPDASAAVQHLDRILGVLQLRRGELENCVHDHNEARCIFPIRGRGRHQEPSGAAAALEHFRSRLRARPDDLETRWLLNVAAMTLGRHPGGLPAGLAIPPAAFESAEDARRFVDVAAAMGLDAPGLAGGVVVDDLDGDGLFDVVVSSVDACVPLRYYRNRGDGTFEDRTEASGLADQLGGINLVQADYDNDGRIDLFVMRGGWQSPMRNSLLRNEGGGRFTDVTEKAGLLRPVRRTHTAAWADFDGDGWLDLFVGNEESPAALFRNRGDGTFVDVAAAAGVGRTAFTKGAAWGDYDLDGHPDLYVSNYAGLNFLYRNRGDGTFEEVSARMGVGKPVMSFPTWFWDYDNDGRLDLFVASYVPSVTEVARHFLGLPRRAEGMKLYRNTGTAFEDVTAAVGLDRVVPTMGANHGDLDNDGFLDFYLGTGAPSYAALMPNVMYRNRGGASFADVTTATGTGHLQKGHGVAFADLDGDGDQDVFANIGGFVPGDAYPRVVFANPGHGNRWILVRLAGVKANRAAIGARLRLTVVGADGRESLRYREVGSGGSFGASPLAQHIGLGRAARVPSLEVVWPGSGTRQVFTDVPLDRVIEIREGDERVVREGGPGVRMSSSSSVHGRMRRGRGLSVRPSFAFSTFSRSRVRARSTIAPGSPSGISRRRSAWSRRSFS
ncbi:MAG TPA: CRTAC1 family protein, partial [Vicinamibacteria bacterium]|nr:CRTAC1 family protein [Vicinamibacteria bacterium]